jgi:hypothetical protein
MRVQRFKVLLDEVLAGIDGATVEHWEFPNDHELTNPRVTFADGTSFELAVTATSPPGGDRHTDPERIVTKHDLAKR